MKTHVVLLNRALGSSHGATKVTGKNGEWVGNSQYNPAYNCHSIELSVEEYEKIASALSAASHLPLRVWEVHFVGEVDQTAEAAVRILKGVVAAIRGAELPADAHPLERAGFEQALSRRGNVESLPDFDLSEFPEVFEGMPFFTLQKIAKLEGCGNIQGMKDGAERVAAIMENRRRIVKERALRAA